jgi:hypothetical protein
MTAMTVLLLLGLVLAIWLLDLAQHRVRARWERRRAGDYTRYTRALGRVRAVTAAHHAPTRDRWSDM